MTIAELIQSSESYQTLLLIYFIAIPILGYGLSFIDKNRSEKNSLDYLLSVLVTAVAIPGLLSLILILYTVLMTNSNMLQVNAVVYFLPPFSMLLTFFLISRNIPMKRIPGYSRLSSIFTMAIIAGLVIYFLQRAGINLIFFGSMGSLLVVGLVLMLLFYIAYARFTKK